MLASTSRLRRMPHLLSRTYRCNDTSMFRLFQPAHPLSYNLIIYPLGARNELCSLSLPPDLLKP